MIATGAMRTAKINAHPASAYLDCPAQWYFKPYKRKRRQEQPHGC